MSEKCLKITLVRSVIGRPQRQRATVRALGLRRLHQSVVHADRPEIRGMARRVQHLVVVEEIPSCVEVESPREGEIPKTEQTDNGSKEAQG